MFNKVAISTFVKPWKRKLNILYIIVMWTRNVKYYYLYACFNIEDEQDSV